MKTKVKQLPPFPEDYKDWKALEAYLIQCFKEKIFKPLFKEIGESPKTLKNSSNYLLKAITSGRITFYRGRFSGSFDSRISKDLRAMGANFDSKTGTYRIGLGDLTTEVKNAISLSASTFDKKLEAIDRKLSQIVPEDIADEVTLSKMFDRTIFRAEKEFNQNVKNITVPVNLSDYEKKKISERYSKNMNLYIQKFTQKSIKKLREDMQKSVFAGNRPDAMVKTIQKQYGVSIEKARFLARQETNLLVSNFHQARFEDAGIEYYKWGCVTGTKEHPVRPMHEHLKGKIFRFDDPPRVNAKGDHKNPKQDYNCRCFAIPLVRYKGPYTKGSDT